MNEQISTTGDARSVKDEIDRARRMLFSGHLTATITSPLGGNVKFRFAPLLPRDTHGNQSRDPWDGRAWWLFRGSEYVGIVKRAGQALELTLTPRSTNDRMILKAAAILLNGLRDAGAPGYDIAAADRCGKCGKELTDPESIRFGIGPVCRGER